MSGNWQVHRDTKQPGGCQGAGEEKLRVMAGDGGDGSVPELDNNDG
jgi:hypothetical protein